MIGFALPDHAEARNATVTRDEPVERAARSFRLPTQTYLSAVAPVAVLFGCSVSLDLAVLTPGVIFELTAQGVERIADRDVGIFMRVVLGRVAANDEFAPRQSAIDTDMEKAALVMVMMRRIDDYVTGGNPIKHPVEPLGPLADAGFEGRRRLHVAKGDLHGVEHDGELPTICGIYFRLRQAVADAGIGSPSSRTPLHEMHRPITSNKLRDVPIRSGPLAALGGSDVLFGETEKGILSGADMPSGERAS
jgi:hypothetical protein